MRIQRHCSHSTPFSCHENLHSIHQFSTASAADVEFGTFLLRIEHEPFRRASSTASRRRGTRRSLANFAHRDDHNHHHRIGGGNDFPRWHGSRHCYDESAHSLSRLRLSMSGLPTLSIVVIVPTMVVSSSSSSYAAVMFVIVKVKDVVRSDQCATENFPGRGRHDERSHSPHRHRPVGPSRDRRWGIVPHLIRPRVRVLRRQTAARSSTAAWPTVRRRRDNGS